MRVLRVCCSLLLSFALTTPGMAEEAPGVAELVDQIIAAYGGRARLAEVKAYRLEATMESPRGGESATITRIVKDAGSFAEMLQYPSRAEIRVVDAGEVRRGSDPARLEPAAGPPADAIRLQAAHVNILELLDTRRGDVQLGAPVETGPVLEVPLRSDLLVRAMIDSSTHRVLATQSIMRLGDQAMQFEARYSDFRPVEGVLFAFHEDKYAGGMHMGSIDVDHVEINPGPERLELEPGTGDPAAP